MEESMEKEVQEIILNEKNQKCFDMIKELKFPFAGNQLQFDHYPVIINGQEEDVKLIKEKVANDISLKHIWFATPYDVHRKYSMDQVAVLEQYPESNEWLQLKDYCTSNCKKCHGRAYTGFDVNTGYFHPCPTAIKNYRKK